MMSNKITEKTLNKFREYLKYNKIKNQGYGYSFNDDGTPFLFIYCKKKNYSKINESVKKFENYDIEIRVLSTNFLTKFWNRIRTIRFI